MKPLRSGYTTGACATAAAKGAALMLSLQQLVNEVTIILPRGDVACFILHGQRFSPSEATCFVVKDAGDDPDITNGAEIHVTISFMASDSHSPSLSPSPSPRPSPTRGEGAIVISGGAGIGKVTKPGLAVKPGEWAINPVPRRMITEAIQSVSTFHSSPFTIHCLISIPNGELLAQKTLNARLGIIGGLSILGTTGVVRPISAQAWTDTIDAAIDVALACGCESVVLSTGRTSELVATKHLNHTPPLPEEAFIMMGDHVGHALRSCTQKGAKQIILAGQFAKLLKIACGHEQTHVTSSDLDLQQLREWLSASPQTLPCATHVNNAITARGVLESSGNDAALIDLVCQQAREFAESLAPGASLKVLLAGYGGEVLYFG